MDPRILKQIMRHLGDLNSGASAMIVAERGWAEKQGLKPMARLVSYGIGAVEPGMFGLGPVPAVRQALSRAGWKISDIQRIEINEAFAAIAIAVTRELGLSEDIVNVEGGSVAHGHPIGATGAVLTTRLLYSMQRDGRHPARRCYALYWRRAGDCTDAGSSAGIGGNHNQPLRLPM